MKRFIGISRWYWIVQVSGQAVLRGPSCERLRELFVLTRTEAAVAAVLGSGQSLEEIAVQMGIGLGTVRTHFKRILAKTGTHRQAQAVALLARSIGAGGAG